MKEEITPEKIQKEYQNGDINKEDAADLLTSLINGSEDAKVRKASIELLEKIDYKDEITFKILENHLISDENASVRASAAKIIIINFLDEGLEPLEWSTKHDKSPLVIKIISDTIEQQKRSNLSNIEENIDKKTLLVKGLVDKDHAKKMGENWREKSFKKINLDNDD